MNSQELLIKYKDFESRLIQVAAQVRGYEESRIFAEETEATRALLLAEIQEQYAAEETNPLAAATFRRAAASPGSKRQSTNFISATMSPPSSLRRDECGAPHN